MTETMHEAALRHRKADMLISGDYWVDGRGCSIGCLAHDLGLEPDDHAGLADHYGVPEWMLRLQDHMFEALAADGAHKDWHVDVTAAYERVTDWPLALHRVHSAMLSVALKTAGDAEPEVRAVQAMHNRAANGELLADEDWSAAESAARSVAWSAARSAARSAAWGAAWGATNADLKTAILAALPTPVKVNK